MTRFVIPDGVNRGGAARVVWVAVLGASALGCAAEEGTPLREWQLVTADGRTTSVVLPAHPDVPRDSPYSLRAHIERPPSLRDRDVTLSIAHLGAPITLRSGGQVVTAVAGDTDGAYRAGGAHAWRLPAGDAPLDLELTVDHRWVGSARLDAVPRLTAGTEAARSSLVRRAVTDLGMLLSLGMLPLLGIAYLALWLGDRRRRPAYGWFGLQMASGTYHALWTLGLTAPFLGTFDLFPLAIAQLLLPLSAVYYGHTTVCGGRPPQTVVCP